MHFARVGLGSRFPFIFASFTLGLLVTTGETRAQATGDEPGNPAGDAESQKPSMLSEIKVTAYRIDAATSATGVATQIIDTPISISAITDQFLRDTGSSQLMDAIGSLTGVTGQSNSGETLGNFAVRGFAVTPQIDGFDGLSTVSGLGSTVGVERVEVLKGPSALFNGNVPPGGNINVIFKKPSFTPNTYVEGRAGSWSYRSGELFSTGPLFSDKLAYLVDAYAKNSDGWVNWTGQNERTIILGLTYRPVESFSVNVNYRNIDNNNQSSTLPVSHQGFIGSGVPQYTYLDDWVAQNYGALEPPQTITVPQYLPGGRRYNVLGPQNYNKENLKFWSGEALFKPNEHIEIRDDFAYTIFTWDLLGLLQSGAKVLGPDGNAGLVSGFLGGAEKGSGWENKLEAAFYFDTGPISHSMLVGYRDSYTKADYLRVWLGGPQVDTAGNPWNFFTDGPLLLQNEFSARLAANPTPDINTSDTAKNRTHAEYIAEQMSALDGRVHALVGARYTKTTTDGLAVSKTTPQIGVLGKPFPADSVFRETSIFANYSKSFTPSGLVQPGSTQTVPPQTGTGKEFGVKTAWLGGRVTSTVSFFRDDLSNIATPDYSQQGMNGQLVLYNLGGVGRSEGWEAEVNWTPINALQVAINYTHLPVAKYVSYPGVPQEEGLRFPSTPVHAGNLTAKYQFEEGWLQGAYVGGWLHAQSETQGVMASDWHYAVHIPDLAQLSAFVGYARGKFDARIDIDNLTDRHGYVMNNAFQPQAPTSAYLTVRYSL